MAIRLFLLSLILVVGAVFVVSFYGYLFAKNVTGEVVAIERVNQAMAIVGGGSIPQAQLFSFAVAVRDKNSGEIITASSEDRQWAVVQKGQCVNVKYFPYPPWSLDRAGTYHGARLLKLYDCPKS